MAKKTAKNKEKFSPIEKEIMGVLASAGKPISTYYVAEKANTTRLTAKKYLLKLMKEGIVIGREYTGTEFKKGLYWWLKYG
jgi:predicted transcriptional regulator